MTLILVYFNLFSFTPTLISRTENAISLILNVLFLHANLLNSASAFTRTHSDASNVIIPVSVLTSLFSISDYGSTFELSIRSYRLQCYCILFVFFYIQCQLLQRMLEVNFFFYLLISFFYFKFSSLDSDSTARSEQLISLISILWSSTPSF